MPPHEIEQNVGQVSSNVADLTSSESYYQLLVSVKGELKSRIIFSLKVLKNTVIVCAVKSPA